MTDRVTVDGPAGPFEVHPQLVEKYPERFRPIAKKPTTQKPVTKKPTNSDLGAENGNLDH